MLGGQAAILELCNVFHTGQVETGGCFQKLSGRVRSGLVLKDVSLSMHSGELLAVLGSKGSGKRALLDVISGRAHGATRGQILLNGAQLTSRIFQRCGAYVTRRCDLLPGLSTEQSLLHAGCLGLGSKVSRYVRWARVKQVLADLALTHVAHRGVERLDASEYRRLAIGVQLVRDPVVLLLDEPTSGLSPLHAYLVLSMLASHARQSGRIVLLSMERPRSDVFPFLDRVAILCLGDVVFAGKTNLLLDYFQGIGFPCPELENPLMYYHSASASLLTPSTSMTPSVVKMDVKPPTNEVEAQHEDDEDAVSAAVGDYGPWQLRLTFLLALFNFPCTWHIMAVTFQTLPAPFWCARPPAFRDWLSVDMWKSVNHAGNDSCQVWDRMYEKELEALKGAPWPPEMTGPFNMKPCESWEFDVSSGDTIISQWQLVCSREQLSNVAEMMFLAGVALGGLISGIVSDRFGRKKALMLSLSIQVLTGTLIAFNPWFELYMVLRFILGFVSVSVVFCSFVLCMELVGGKWRTISGVSFLFPVPLGYITIAGIAYLVRGWRYLQLAVTLPAMLLFGLWWVIPESPRWLLAMGRREELVKVLQKGAKTNKRPIPSNPDKIIPPNPEAEKAKEAEGRPGFCDLFRYAHIRRISLLLYILWFTLYLVYYGITLNLGNMSGDIYVNTALAGLVELPAVAISILSLLWTGRKTPLCITMAGSGVACLLTLTVPTDDPDLQWISLTFTMIGKFAISCSNAILPVFTAELFPTVVRNLGVGSSNMAAGVALMLTPYLWNLTAIMPQLPMIVLGSLGVIGGICVFFLPETAGKAMPETLADLERRGNEEAVFKEKEELAVKTISGGTYRKSVVDF